MIYIYIRLHVLMFSHDVKIMGYSCTTLFELYQISRYLYKYAALPLGIRCMLT